MGKRLFVGNLGYDLTDHELVALFAALGTVESAQVIIDPGKGRSKGFGFVELQTEREATAAVLALNGQDVGGRPLTVSAAKPKPSRGREPVGGPGDYGGG